MSFLVTPDARPSKTCYKVFRSIISDLFTLDYAQIYGQQRHIKNMQVAIHTLGWKEIQLLKDKTQCFAQDSNPYPLSEVQYANVKDSASYSLMK